MPDQGRPLVSNLRRVAAQLPSNLNTLAASVYRDVPASIFAAELSTEIQLSPAERRTLVALSGPGTLASAAQRLHLSPNTLKTQARGIYRKLGVSSRDEMVTTARALGLIE